MAGKCAIAGMVCPQTNDGSKKYFCPAWWETTWTNDTGEVHIAKGCAWTQLPDYLNQMVKNTVGAAKSSQEARDAALSYEGEMRNGMRTLALTVHARNLQGGQAPSLNPAEARPALPPGPNGRAATDVSADLEDL